jgi:hypothetical protein
MTWLSTAVPWLTADTHANVLVVAGMQGSESATTEQLEAQLVENTEAVEECMAALQVGFDWLVRKGLSGDS